jgi:arylsulfatase A-like enzyme
MPCMPARRELHTGRYNFLHRSWGPLEPFDRSMPEILTNAGVYTHLITDHQHYWEDGGATYHNRYNSYEFFRGQEGDLWKGIIGPLDIPENMNGREGAWGRQDWINRSFVHSEADLPQAKTFEAGLEFIRTNAGQDNWFLQIETFDPHEPYFTTEDFKALYAHDYQGPIFDWPPYAQVNETPEQIEHVRREYAALLSTCDRSLGKVLDLMDEHDLWKDTMLIVNTDHGFLLGEHNWWAKNIQPYYNEIAHAPLFIWDPRSRITGERRGELVQMIDMPMTLLAYFGLEAPPEMQGIDLLQTISNGAPTRDAALFGVFGGHVNVTDGRYVYMRAARPENSPLYDYTLIPTHMRGRFDPSELQEAVLFPSLPFTQGCPVLKIPARAHVFEFTTRLFDLQTDPAQQHPIEDPSVEARMIDHLLRLMQQNDAPAEQFERLGLRQ